jgi:hypothetical protein
MPEMPVSAPMRSVSLMMSPDTLMPPAYRGQKRNNSADVLDILDIVVVDDKHFFDIFL